MAKRRDRAGSGLRLIITETKPVVFSITGQEGVYTKGKDKMKDSRISHNNVSSGSSITHHQRRLGSTSVGITSAWIPLMVTVCLWASAGTAAEEKLNPRAARSVHLWYPAEQGIVYYNEVTVEKSYPGSYFCVCGFRHGYFGIQELWKGNKVVIFSVWDPGKQNNPDTVPEDNRVKVLYEGQDVRISRFGNEGTGGRSIFDYPWNVGETYRCMVKTSVDGDKTTYAAYFYLNEEKKWKHLATFQTITGGDYLN
ncbi:MAG: DUF3472 domain-containing protein, partial [Planctomycetota bacterium]